jgi:methylaspartate ammonia-lyase
MIKARIRGLGAADPFALGYNMLGQQLSYAQQQALLRAPEHARRSTNPETQIDDSGCAQVLESVDYFGAPPEQRQQLLDMCKTQGIESFMLAAEQAGFDTSAAAPWYKRPTTWVIAGAVVLGGVLLSRLL